MTEPLPHSDEQQELLARYLTGESTPEEQAMVRRWAERDPANRKELETLEAQLNRLALTPGADLDVDRAWRRVAAGMENEDVRRLDGTHRRPALAAAAVIALVALGGIALWRAHQALPLTQELTTGTGRRDSVHFTDGTRIIIAAGSHLSLEHQRGDRPREVRLEGEAYFDVRHDTTRPFTVRTGNLTVTDLGTAFSVRSTAGGATEVRVIDGSVSVRVPEGDSAVVLCEGDRATWRAGEGLRILHGVAAHPPAWLEGRLEFDDAPLSEVGRELQRWYGIELRLADSALAGRHLTATFSGEPASRVAEIVALTLGAKLELAGDTATLRLQPDRPSIK